MQFGIYVIFSFMCTLVILFNMLYMCFILATQHRTRCFPSQQLYFLLIVSLHKTGLICDHRDGVNLVLTDALREDGLPEPVSFHSTVNGDQREDGWTEE